MDASKGMVGWAKENAKSSGLSEAPIRWIVDDCVKFVEREIRRGNHYDGIILSLIHISFLVGNGTGPLTCEPVFLTVSIIFPAD